eukprot:CAMPEP_0197556502 /NCGR_PEP_ID=MMETSP1320-20131121/15261_1 /TAXON_ID=91990 /ORGANISM="Bolidomonas sp., Strain RCC2347" /LENGTH=102 /DNA_ID=CAMNT_0043117637 /DNA_START=194 /DNA_END=498 /DNA_ORIENTATION=-
MASMDPDFKAALQGVRKILISRDVSTPYSGMVPGFVSGSYTRSECHLDLSKLCRFGGFEFVRASATALALAPGRGGYAATDDEDRPEVWFDACSIDVGSSPT